MAELIIASGTMKGQRLILPDREVIVGRDEDCNMRIASSMISRKHCALQGARNGVWVRDLESQNGTYVNDVAIKEPYLMKPGDVLRIGSSQFQVPRAKPAASPDGGIGELLDDDISTWLAEEAPTESAALPDTTVIKGRQPAVPVPKPVDDERPPVGSVAPPVAEARMVPAIRQVSKSVKEQAAEIIRRHWESVRSPQ